MELLIRQMYGDNEKYFLGHVIEEKAAYYMTRSRYNRLSRRLGLINGGRLQCFVPDGDNRGWNNLGILTKKKQKPHLTTKTNI